MKHRKIPSEYKATVAPIKNYSWAKKSSFQGLRVLKSHQYYVWQPFASGDAPKDLLKVYEYGVCRKANPKCWTPYIAKIGHKWYPIESIMEHMLTRIGQVLGFDMADSTLYIVKGQIRFCSKYFLKPEQELVHAADIIARYLNEQPQIVDDIDHHGWSQELLTMQLVEESVMGLFYNQWNQIRDKLCDMLLFDALTGNNDRHFYNWGIVRHVKNLHEPFFSPIYDSARGLGWNRAEKFILNLQHDIKQREQFIVKYNQEAQPKIGWQGFTGINHIQMVELLLQHHHCPGEKAQKLFTGDNLQLIFTLINREFRNLLSVERIDLIKRLLEARFKAFQQMLNG